MVPQSTTDGWIKQSDYACQTPEKCWDIGSSQHIPSMFEGVKRYKKKTNYEHIHSQSDLKNRASLTLQRHRNIRIHTTVTLLTIHPMHLNLYFS